MKTMTSIQLLRLITVLPLVIVLLAIASGKSPVSRPPADQLMSDSQQHEIGLPLHG